MGILIDNGQGIEEPIIEKGDICIFDIGDSYILRHRQKGDLATFSKEGITDEFFNGLESEGWHRINLNSTDDD